VLLIGESPPRGRGFFYTGDSALYRFTAPVLLEECSFPQGRERFLGRFSDAGFFLDDLSPTRGDKPAARASDPDVRAAVARLAATISADAPVVVVGVLLSLRALVREIVAASSRPHTPWECLHFPHPRNEEEQRRYKAGLRKIVREFGCDRGSGP
jgi:hypothetical protein